MILPFTLLHPSCHPSSLLLHLRERHDYACRTRLPPRLAPMDSSLSGRSLTLIPCFTPDCFSLAVSAADSDSRLHPRRLAYQRLQTTRGIAMMMRKEEEKEDHEALLLPGSKDRRSCSAWIEESASSPSWTTVVSITTVLMITFRSIYSRDSRTRFIPNCVSTANSEF